WDLTPLYPDEDTWEQDFKEIDTFEKRVQSLQGRLSLSADILAQGFQYLDDLSRKIDRLYTYAHLRADEDTSNTFYMGLQDRIYSRASQSQAALAWFEREVLAIPDERMADYRREPVLKPYLRALELLIRQKPHILSPS